MPYINQERRDLMDSGDSYVATVGELNYAITRLCHEYAWGNKLSYAILNDILGVLEGAKLEFYRTVVAPYEDLKRKENGSISNLDKPSKELTSSN